MEDKRRNGIIATVISFLTCGCSAACMFFFGIAFSFGEVTTWTLDFPPETFGIVMLCLSCFAILVPIGVAAYTFWPKKDALESLESNEAGEETEEELPPAI